MIESLIQFGYVQVLVNPWLALGLLTTTDSYKAAGIATLISFIVFGICWYFS